MPAGHVGTGQACTLMTCCQSQPAEAAPASAPLSHPTAALLPLNCSQLVFWSQLLNAAAAAACRTLRRR